MQINQINGVSSAQELFDTLTENTRINQPEENTEKSGFQATLQQMVQDIDQLQKQLDHSLHQLTVPEQANIGEKMQTADSTYDMMMGVKSRLMDAYQAIAL